MTGKRVNLRPLEHTDLEFLRDLANDPVVRANVVGWDWPLSLSGQEKWFERSAESQTTRRFIVETVSGQPIGMTGLWDVDWRSGTAMTALKLGGTGRESVHGRGLGTEAIHEIMDFAFNDVGLNKLHSTIVSGNVASLAAYIRKSGWTQEGVLRQHVWRNGKLVDLIQVGILRDEFFAFAQSGQTP